MDKGSTGQAIENGDCFNGKLVIKTEKDFRKSGGGIRHFFIFTK